MNSRQMIAKLDGYGGIIPFNSEELDVTLRALRLLAAAEYGDAERSKLVEDLRTEADLCRNETAEDIAELLDDAASSIVAMSLQFKALKDERNGLAARVGELEAIRTQMVDAADATLCDPSGQVVIHGSAADLDILQSAIDAARSKP